MKWLLWRWRFLRTYSRVRAACCDASPIDIDYHADRVTRTVMRARRKALAR